MPDPEPLIHGQYYHIYIRGNNGEIPFCEEWNYPYFLGLYVQYVEPDAKPLSLSRANQGRRRGPAVLNNKKGDPN